MFHSQFSCISVIFCMLHHCQRNIWYSIKILRNRWVEKVISLITFFSFAWIIKYYLERRRQKQCIWTQCFEHDISEQTHRTREEWAKIYSNEVYNSSYFIFIIIIIIEESLSSATTNLFVTENWNICKIFHGIYYEWPFAIQNFEGLNKIDLRPKQ